MRHKDDCLKRCMSHALVSSLNPFKLLLASLLKGGAEGFCFHFSETFFSAFVPIISLMSDHVWSKFNAAFPFLKFSGGYISAIYNFTDALFSTFISLMTNAFNDSLVRDYENKISLAVRTMESGIKGS